MHDWSSAHLTQAYYDYRMFLRINNDEVEDAQKIYFLQKMSEKAAQSYLTDGSSPPAKDHQSMLRFIRAVKTDQLLKTRIARRMKVRDFLKKVSRIEAFAKELHRLIPLNEQTANCEYPWKDRDGIIRVPSETRFHILRPEQAPLLRKYMALFEMWFAASGFQIGEN